LNLGAPTEMTGLAGETPAAAASPSPAELAPHFPQLEILRCLGRGGMGVVYEARQKSLDRRVALKLLAPERVTDPQFAERFQREARALARLSHPNIVTIHDFGVTAPDPGPETPDPRSHPPFYYLLMEFVDGVNLRQLLASRKITPEEALAIVPPICEALQYAHEQGIVHRDIKPENLLLDKQGRVKIADFGIARLLGRDAPAESTTGQQSLGTPHYMAPEQRAQPQTVDHRADIYSLGVVFYEMLTGELPAGRFPLPSRRVRVDVRLDEIVLRALEHEPERRYQTAGEFKTQVETVTAGPREEAQRQSSTSPTEPDQRRWARLGFALLLAGTLGTLVLMTLSPRHELALTFAGAALLFALILGIKSWRDRLGKTVALTTLTLLVAAGVTILILAEVIPLGGARREAEWQRAEARARQEFARLEALKQARQKAANTASNTPVQIQVTADGMGDYPTIQAAIEAAPTNAIIYIGPGRYRERLDIRKPLRFVRRGDSIPVIGPETPQERSVLAGERAAPPLPTVQIRGTTNVFFHYLQFTEPGLPEAGRLSPQAVMEVTEAQVSLENCAIVGGPGNGLVFGQGATGKLWHTLVAAVWNTGVVIGAGSRVEILSCDIRNCHYAGVVVRRDAGRSGIHMNRISGSAWHGIRYDDASPLISGNVIFANARSGIYASGASRAQVRDNVFFDNEMNGISCWYDNRDTITGNTFAGNRREALSVLGASAPTITSNIFSGHPVAIHQGLIGDSRSSATHLGDPVVRGNLFWQNGTNWIRWGPPPAGQEPRPEIVSLDETAHLVEPGFANAVSSDYSLLPDSAAARANLGVAKPLSPASPWPLQPEELAIIPDGPTRDSRQWKRPVSP